MVLPLPASQAHHSLLPSSHPALRVGHPSELHQRMSVYSFLTPLGFTYSVLLPRIPASLILIRFKIYILISKFALPQMELYASHLCWLPSCTESRFYLHCIHFLIQHLPYKTDTLLEAETVSTQPLIPWTLYSAGIQGASRQYETELDIQPRKVNAPWMSPI